MALSLNFLTFNLKYVSEKNMGLYFHMTLNDQFGRICDKLEGSKVVCNSGSYSTQYNTVSTEKNRDAGGKTVKYTRRSQLYDKEKRGEFDTKRVLYSQVYGIYFWLHIRLC